MVLAGFNTKPVVGGKKEEKVKDGKGLVTFELGVFVGAVATNVAYNLLKDKKNTENKVAQWSG